MPTNKRKYRILRGSDSEPVESTSGMADESGPSGADAARSADTSAGNAEDEAKQIAEWSTRIPVGDGYRPPSRSHSQWCANETWLVEPLDFDVRSQASPLNWAAPIAISYGCNDPSGI
ncbi:unnamed protein product [Polarella glacialis]|uniref:Uncharacterized protein n=1 Tax=Polarella glacialis TaxID=89957 RepID=A0A813EZ95_POLGL|nr:unnamed protein product [Polarella glacialis]